MADYGGLGGGNSLRDALNQIMPMTGMGEYGAMFPPNAGAPEPTAPVPLPQSNPLQQSSNEAGLVGQYEQMLGRSSSQWSPQDVVRFQDWRAKQAGTPIPQPRPPMPPPQMGIPPQGQQPGMQGLVPQGFPQQNYAQRLGLTQVSQGGPPALPMPYLPRGGVDWGPRPPWNPTPASPPGIPRVG